MTGCAGGWYPPLQKQIHANIAKISRDAEGGVPYKERRARTTERGLSSSSRTFLWPLYHKNMTPSRHVQNKHYTDTQKKTAQPKEPHRLV